MILLNIVYNQFNISLKPIFKLLILIILLDIIYGWIYFLKPLPKITSYCLEPLKTPHSAATKLAELCLEVVAVGLETR